MTIGLRHYKQELNKIWVLPRLATYDVNYKSLNCIEAMPRISSSCCLSRSRQSYFACNPRYTLCYTSRFLDGILFARGPCAWLSLRFCGNWKRIQLLILFSTSLATLPWRVRSTPRCSMYASSYPERQVLQRLQKQFPRLADICIHECTALLSKIVSRNHVFNLQVNFLHLSWAHISDLFSCRKAMMDSR